VSSRERRRRRSPRRRRVIWVVVLVLVFAVGVALGQALEDNPKPGSTVTQKQTFTVPPASATVTVTAP
jgi:type II secretory pathway component PulL